MQEQEHKPKALTVENLINSLAQIELWIKAVRAALHTLPPDTTLNLTSAQIKAWTSTPMSPLRTGRECPPPE
jgi:hypothetical protein